MPGSGRPGLFHRVPRQLSGRKRAPLGLLIFLIGILFAAAQTAHMTFTSELAPAGMAGQTFGMWNLVAEVGAVISPVLSGALRDLTGDWTVAIILDGILLFISALMVLFVQLNEG